MAGTALLLACKVGRSALIPNSRINGLAANLEVAIPIDERKVVPRRDDLRLVQEGWQRLPEAWPASMVAAGA